MSEFLARIGNYSAKRLALLADELNSRVQTIEAARHEPIAIIGMGCRFPGGADTPQKYWQLLRDGVDAISEVPGDRWAIDDLYDPDPDAPGRMSTRWGGFVGPVDGFDSHFFGISPREAQSLDPQQRLLLETTWRALEDANIAAGPLEGSRTAVYLGLSAGDYYQKLLAQGTGTFDAYTASGIAHSIASGRLSYFLGLRGPSVSIDTACSSSMVALHHAVHSLRRGESDLALAGGVNLILGPEISVALSRSHMMAPDGRCKAFDSRADGFVRGEGCGMLVLKRLTDARADHDRIVAVIRGSASNQDGRSNGLTAPNGPSQEAVLRDALADARIEAQSVGYVEAHGTGTALGDPIEVQALQAVLGAGRSQDAPLLVGSVKANIGHLEAAAGVAGVIKLALALQHGELPGQLHLQQPNPHIRWDEIGVRVSERLQPWPQRPGERRIGGVSSFGFSGTNVHLLMEQAPAEQAAAPSVPEGSGDRPLHLLTVSARSEAALDALLAAWRQRLQGDGALADLAYSANVGRTHFPHRLAVTARSAAEAADRLGQCAGQGDGTQVEGIHRAVAANRAPKIAFLFTGQGAQYAGMARSLFETDPLFRGILTHCDELLAGRLARPLLSILYGERSEGVTIDDTECTQPALFAIEYALARLWMSWGVQPSMVMGHSVGEFVAACIAGVFSLDDALQLVAARGRLMGALPRDGAMASVMASQEQVAGALADQGAQGDVGIAAVNGPHGVVISGSSTAVASVLERLEAGGIRSTRLNVSHAFHSRLMTPMLDAFDAVARQVGFATPRIDLVSNVTGKVIGERIADPAYWREHVLAPVRFADAIAVMARKGCSVFLEVGPQPTLLGMARQCIDDDAVVWLPSLRRGREDWSQLLESLSALYVRGTPVDWAGFDAGRTRRPASLPGYPFQRERYWVAESTPGVAVPAPASTPAALHPLLGWEVFQSISEDRLFESRIGTAGLPWLKDHRIQGALLLPSPVLMEMAIAAGCQRFGDDRLCIHDLVVHQPLSVDAEAPVTVQTLLAEPSPPSTDGAGPVDDVRISSRAEDGRRWLVHASGRVSRLEPAAEPRMDPEGLRQALTEWIPVTDYYGWLDSLGLEFGPLFRAAQSIMRRDGEVLGRMVLPDGLLPLDPGYWIHPALLDGCLHLIGAALAAPEQALKEAFLLLNVERIELHRRPGTTFWNRISVAPEELTDLDTRETFRADMALIDDEGNLLMRLSGLNLKRARRTVPPQGALPARVRGMLHEIAWRDAPLGEAQLPSVPALVEGLGSKIERLARDHRLDAYADFIPGLDRLASIYIVDALTTLGFVFEPGLRFTSEDLRARLGVIDRHRRLFGRMLDILAEDGILGLAEGTWQVLCRPLERDGEAACTALLAGHPDCEAELALTRRCGSALALALCGRTDPLGLLFPEGSLESTERLYQNSPPARTYNALIAELVTGIQSRFPSDRPLRILEIGAGTGSTTAYLLPALARHPGPVEYVFTDVSPLFLSRARTKFSGATCVQYRLLDIGANPLRQGLQPAGFDIVIGANVLHATPDLATSLGHVRSLMAPGAYLVLLEGTTPQRFGDLTVGLLEGWWNHTDTDRRSYALMPRSSWLDLLRQQGFQEPTAIPGDDAGPVLEQQAVFVARAPEAAVDAAVAAATLRPRWLILADRGGLAPVLAGCLAERGDRAEIVTAAPGQSIEAAVQHALEQPAAGLIHLGALDLETADDTTPERLLAGQQALMVEALAMVRALLASPAAGMPRLCFVTRGGQAVDDTGADPGQATLWGLSHVVAIEHPELQCRRIDLDPGDEASASSRVIAAELLGPPGREDQTAWRGGRRFARRLAPAPARPLPQPPAAIVDPARSYLVTGGMRGLGLLAAQWLADQGARHLVLMGRRPPDERTRAAMDRLESAGVRVLAVQGDVSSRPDLARTLQTIAQQLPPLAGVIHAAGVLDDGVVTAQNWSRFATVMGPKVLGSWHLHQLTAGLSFLVLFSSGASLAGSAGQGNHAAANAFEDALAWYRQARGMPTLSINWGAWAEVGAAADRSVSRRDLQPIAPRDGLQALAFGLACRRQDGLFQTAQFGVLNTDWSHLRVGQEGGWPLFAELVAQSAGRGPDVPAPAAPAGTAGAGTLPLRERVLAAMPNRRMNVLRAFVLEQTVKVLGIRNAQALDVNEPFRQLGLDSLMAVELRNLLGKALQHPLPATVTFDHPSVAALAEHIWNTVFHTEVARESRPAAPEGLRTSDAAGAALTEEALSDLSQQDLASLLAQKLESLGIKDR